MDPRVIGRYANVDETVALHDLPDHGVTIVDRAKVSGTDGRLVRLAGTFGEERPAIDEVDALVSLVGVAGISDLAVPLRAVGIKTLVGDDAHLPRDVAGAVLQAAWAVEGLVAAIAVTASPC